MNEGIHRDDVIEIAQISLQHIADDELDLSQTERSGRPLPGHFNQGSGYVGRDNVGASGGYGVVIGPRASKAELEETRAQIIEDPGNFISQPVIGLSVCPTVCDDGIEPRHIDLRPFAVTGKDTWVLPGGLTRVALRKNSLVVNSSQGGGSKDTWVLFTQGGR